MLMLIHANTLSETYCTRFAFCQSGHDVVLAETGEGAGSSTLRRSEWKPMKQILIGVKTLGIWWHFRGWLKYSARHYEIIWTIYFLGFRWQNATTPMLSKTLRDSAMILADHGRQPLSDAVGKDFPKVYGFDKSDRCSLSRTSKNKVNNQGTRWWGWISGQNREETN